jgi:hypothetical protein
MDEYHLMLVAVRVADVAAIAPYTIIWSPSLQEATRFAELWALDQAPPSKGWEGHTLRVTPLAELRQPVPAGLSQ